MRTRRRLATLFLGCVLVTVGTMFGASVYQRIAMIPVWSGDLPQSAVRYFQGTPAGPAMDRFWTSVTGPTSLSIILALALSWPDAARRRWIVRGAVLFFAMLAWTFVYFIPKGVLPLMVHGCEGLSPDAITQMGRAWVFWDWFRMAGTLAAYVCFIKAVAVPVHEKTPPPATRPV